MTFSEIFFFVRILILFPQRLLSHRGLTYKTETNINLLPLGVQMNTNTNSSAQELVNVPGIPPMRVMQLGPDSRQGGDNGTFDLQFIVSGVLLFDR